MFIMECVRVPWEAAFLRATAKKPFMGGDRKCSVHTASLLAPAGHREEGKLELSAAAEIKTGLNLANFMLNSLLPGGKSSARQELEENLAEELEGLD
jgi:hypothetical protein